MYAAPYYGLYSAWFCFSFSTEKIVCVFFCRLTFTIAGTSECVCAPTYQIISSNCFASVFPYTSLFGRHNPKIRRSKQKKRPDSSTSSEKQIICNKPNGRHTVREPNISGFHPLTRCLSAFAQTTHSGSSNLNWQTLFAYSTNDTIYLFCLRRPTIANANQPRQRREDGRRREGKSKKKRSLQTTMEIIE